ncbi:hypothetical protein KST27_01035 [Fusobacterium nucleatum]|uniref:hypothetical protein n=1 Tax=Fusobacterium nucleatum TaxID=851 RepID=UPI0030D606CB
MKNNWRIYLNGRGYRHCRPFLDWCKTLPEVKEDRKGNKYIFVNDLLKYKGQLVGTNLHNKTRLNWQIWLKNEVVAFDEVNNFITGLNLPAEIMEKIRVYGISTTLDSNFKKEELKVFFKTVSLEEWI